jgi:hypothetical protein
MLCSNRLHDKNTSHLKKHIYSTRNQEIYLQPVLTGVFIIQVNIYKIKLCNGLKLQLDKHCKNLT